METNQEEAKGLQKGLGKEISQMEERIQELPTVKKDAKKAFLILIITVVIAVLMKDVLRLEDWWLLVISILNIVSVMAVVILIVICARWYYLKGIQELIEKDKEKQKK